MRVLPSSGLRMRVGAWAPLCLVAAILASISCRREVAPVSPTTEPAPQALSVTRWTTKTELFVEYPSLVVGKTARFAVHLTRLDTFKPLTEGRVEVRLGEGTESPEVFSAAAPSRPGIFGVDVTPARTGQRTMTITVVARDLSDAHELGVTTVHPSAAAAGALGADERPAAEAVTFLKEQQWALDFGTELVTDRALHESVPVSATITARPGGASDVVAPFDGRLVSVVDAAIGAAIEQGQELGRLQPLPPTLAELPQLHQARAEATSLVQLTTRDRERAERLVAAGAAPQRRLDEARAAEEQAQAKRDGADARLAQHRAARAAGAGGETESAFALRAPAGGVLVERTAITGGNVSEGDVLFRLLDARHVQVTAHVPETELARVRHAQTAELEVPGLSPRVSVGRLSAVGRVLDPRTRTVPITFALDNRQLGLAVGQAVVLHLRVAEAPSRPVVPASALVDDGGRPIVFVQREGEAFERRPVTLGARDGEVVQIVDGVHVGDRVVTTGAYLIRLASLSTQVPSHGHVH